MMGETKFITGEPCIYGHYSERYTKNAGCCECSRIGRPSKRKDSLAKKQSLMKTRMKRNGFLMTARKAMKQERENQIAAAKEFYELYYGNRRKAFEQPAPGSTKPEGFESLPPDAQIWR